MSVFLSTDEVARLTGISHRQLDYGYRSKVLIPIGGGAGSGSRLKWSPSEVAVIRRLAEVASVLRFVEFTDLARSYAADLRDGNATTVSGEWGEFRIDPPKHVDDNVDPRGELHIQIITTGDRFAVECDCGWATERPHLYQSALDIANAHNRGIHGHRGTVSERVSA